MITLTMVNESKKVSAADFAKMVEAAKAFVPLVTAFWEKPAITVTTAPARVAGTWNVCILDNFPNIAMNAKASGYHEVVNKTPIAYARVNTRYMLGSYFKGIIRKNGTVVLPPRCTQGVITTVLHEIAEMIIDPFISERRTDALNRAWVLEVCDHAMSNWDLVVGGVNVIAPDFTLPAFYTVGANGPYSYRGTAKAPFTLSPGSYGFYDTPKGLHAL